jgi:uncharacterized protein
LRGIQPLLHQGLYGQAMMSGAAQIGSDIARAKGVGPANTERPQGRRVQQREGLPWPVVVIGIIVLLFLLGTGGGRGFLAGMILGNLLGSGGRGGGGWGGGGFGSGGGGGGFGGFGGGDSGGGGASGSW